MQHLQPTRRQLLQGASGLIITFALGARLERNGRAQQAIATPVASPAPPSNQTVESVLNIDPMSARVDSWLAIDKDGNVTIYVGKVELGTGIMTALAQIAAEELDVPFARVTVIQGDTERTPDQGYTAGSMSIQAARPILQQAAADARLALLERAADRLGAPISDLEVHDGVISAGDASKSVPYGALVDGPFLQELNG